MRTKQIVKCLEIHLDFSGVLQKTKYIFCTNCSEENLAFLNILISKYDSYRSVDILNTVACVETIRSHLCQRIRVIGKDSGTRHG
jgi:hypothetical protein